MVVKVEVLDNVTDQMQTLFDTLNIIFPHVDFTVLIDDKLLTITLPNGKYPILPDTHNSKLKMKVDYIDDEFCIYLAPEYVEFYEKFKELVPNVTISDVFDNRYVYNSLVEKLQDVVETYYCKCLASEVPDGAIIIDYQFEYKECRSVSFMLDSENIADLTSDLLAKLQLLLTIDILD